MTREPDPSFEHDSELDEATIVVNSPAAPEVSHAPASTVPPVAAPEPQLPSAAAADPSAAAQPGEEQSHEDHTIVSVSDQTVWVASDETQMAPSLGRRERRIADRAQHEETERVQSLGLSHPASPVEQPREERELRHIVGVGLDPNRPIAPAPGAPPWELQGERGVSRGLPVSYGARPSTAMPVQTGRDEILRTIGPAPAPTEVAVVQGRAQLPSLQQRDRKRKIFTLAMYAGVLGVSVLGLWGVALIAFG